MTINELERIRKVEVVPHDPNWIPKYISEARTLRNIFGDKLHSIHHVGSTAIINSHAKPIIDIMPIFFNLEDVDFFNKSLECVGYTVLGEYGLEGRRFFYKGVEKREFNMHAFQFDSEFARKNLLFRDHMNNYPKDSKNYSNLKIKLSSMYPTDIESYVNGKSDYVNNIMTKINENPVTRNYDPLTDKVELSPYNDDWSTLGKDEIETIRKNDINKFIVDIQHIGSTSIKGVCAKPIIDIMIGVNDIGDAESLVKPLEALEYLYWAENPDKTRKFFVKGMPPKGTARTHHVHIVTYNDHRWVMKTLFRDFLNSNPSSAQEYNALKMVLAEFYQYDREQYTHLKSALVAKILKRAGYVGEVER